MPPALRSNVEMGWDLYQRKTSQICQNGHYWQLGIKKFFLALLGSGEKYLRASPVSRGEHNRGISTTMGQQRAKNGRHGNFPLTVFVSPRGQIWTSYSPGPGYCEIHMGGIFIWGKEKNQKRVKKKCQRQLFECPEIKKSPVWPMDFCMTRLTMQATVPLP